MESFVEISLVFQVHPSEEVLEAYAFSRLSGDHLSRVEEHLLVCEACRLKVEQADEFIRLVKTGAALESMAPWRGVWTSIRSRLPAPTATWMGIVVSACLLGAVLLPRTLSPPPAPVRLHSYRGGESLHGENGAMNLAPVSRPLDLFIPADEVPFKPEYRIEVVTDAGRTVWTGAARPVTGELTARMTRRLDAGLYWVRLYDEKSELLSEFGLRVK